MNNGAGTKLGAANGRRAAGNGAKVPGNGYRKVRLRSRR